MTAEDASVTVPRLVGMKKAKRKISMLTAYDFPTARLLDEAGIDAILVGDSLAMVVQGHDTTLPVTLEQMIYHAEMVGRAVRRALVIVDLPFPLSSTGLGPAIDAASKILKQTRAQAVKLESGEEQAEIIRGLVAAGIPVMAHCGLRPQNIRVLGGYKVARDADNLMAAALAAEAAGAFAVVLECIPEQVARDITARLQIPTIGIGAGAGCDGQVLVTHDMLGFTTGYVPKFAKAYTELKDEITRAVKRYREDVTQGTFPGPDQLLR